MARRWRRSVLITVLLLACAPMILFMLHGESRCRSVPITKMQVERVAFAVDQYRSDVGRLPASLQVLLDDDPPGLGPYVRAGALRDPWNRNLYFGRDPDGDGFVVFSLGRDGRPGGEGADADIAASRPDQIPRK